MARANFGENHTQLAEGEGPDDQATKPILALLASLTNAVTVVWYFATPPTSATQPP